MSVDLPGLPTLSNAAAITALALVLLAFAVAALRRAVRGVELARLPVAPQQELRLDTTGPVVLHGEGPRFTSRFHGLAFRLLERATGAMVPQRRPWVHATVAGWSRVRVMLVRFDLERAGAFRLEVSGLDPHPRDDECAFVLMPPVGMRLPLAIVGCVLTGAAAIGSVVALGWIVLAGKGGPLLVTADVPAAPTLAVPASGGRQLPTADAAGATHELRTTHEVRATHEVRWNGVGLTLSLPVGWQARSVDAELDVRDPARASTYLAGHVVTFPPPTGAEVLARVVLESAAGKLRAGLIDGYAAVRWGGVAGVLTIESRGDGANRMVVWSAYRLTRAGVQNVTLVFGAEAAEFDRLAAVAQIALASARFD